MSGKKYDPRKERKDNKDKRGRMYGYEEGDTKPSSAEGGASGENIATREGAIEGNTRKKGISYEPDTDRSTAQGGFGQGSSVNKGSEGPQGYSGEGGSDNYEDENFNGAVNR
jgi:hypothetical protein